MGDLLIVPLAIIFGISFVIFLYVAGYSWYLGGPATAQGAPWLYSSGIICGSCLFVLSNIYYSRRHKGISPSQRLMLGFFDLSTFFSVSVLILWGLVLPILRPISSPDFQLYLFDQKSLAMGLYTGLILCSLVVVFRVALQFLITRSASAVMVIPAPPKPIFINRTEVKEKTTIEDSLSSIRSENRAVERGNHIPQCGQGMGVKIQHRPHH